MRVSAVTASLVLGAAFISTISVMTAPARADEANTACPCNFPDDHKAKPRDGEASTGPNHKMPSYAEGNHYSYRAAPAYRREWHSVWRVVSDSAYLPGPSPKATAYYPISRLCRAGRSGD